jgi:hypothetical protein
MESIVAPKSAGLAADRPKTGACANVAPHAE